MSNSSTTTSSTESLSCQITTTLQSCEVDPIVHLFEQMVAGADNLPFSNNSYSCVLNRLLDKGVIEDNCKYCCPDCGNMYTVGSIETFLKLAEQLGFTQSAAVPA
jgi:hypothetical protein